MKKNLLNDKPIYNNYNMSFKMTNIVNQITQTELEELRKLNEKYTKLYQDMIYYHQTILRERTDLLNKYGYNYETHFIDINTGKIKERGNKNSANI